ncbi:hypothetical protein INT43_006567 [Umbelopsis isabellina]|uniref:Ubiquitin carboxyl-terminal hydrolase n=1 Tax=Mortierella isabellina TaxID=91625 RepID=A0A8H7UF85_MORIS|nr:hypothetical protein INT43_006567 [Umbelopsis isabellina]
MTPQADSTTATAKSNGHQNGSTEVNHSVYDLLYSSEIPLSFYSSEDQKQNHNIATAGCKHLIVMKNHQATSDHSEAREKFREIFSLSVDYGVAWKIATSEMQMSKASSDKSKSKKRKLHQDVPVPQSMDFTNHMIYCSLCSDYIYDKELYDLFIRPKLAKMQKYMKQDRRNYISYIDWSPTDSEIELITTHSTLPPCRGVRGLTNMGNTCFMNVILQSMVHNPLLRAHFLSDRHNHALCKRKFCLCCEMDNLFIQLYSGERSPYGPCTFLQSMWLSLKELAGYAQQDAHEFFISALNQIHADSEDHSMDNCHCVVHQTFAGVLQSNVTCLKCGNVSSAYDPMLDISLDLLPAEKKKKQQLSVANDNLGKSTNTLSSTNDKRETHDSESNQSFFAARRAREPNSLADCLDRYTKPEKLGENQYSCANCGHTFQAAVKQLSVKKLPQVLSFQLKRFEHGKSATKIETKIKFPVDLDMTPYTSDSSESNAKIRDQKLKRALKLPLSHGSNLYTLFAVVNHQGKMDTGHYTMFAKHRGQWFKFDDHRVTLSYQKDVLDSKAYMCFYIKKSLEYSVDVAA